MPKSTAFALSHYEVKNNNQNNHLRNFDPSWASLKGACIFTISLFYMD